MLGCKKLGITLKTKQYNKINCIHVVIFQLNFINIWAISDTLEHLNVNYCIKLLKTGAYFPVNKRPLKNHQETNLRKDIAPEIAQKNWHALLTHTMFTSDMLTDISVFW